VLPGSRCSHGQRFGAKADAPGRERRRSDDHRLVPARPRVARCARPPPWRDAPPALRSEERSRCAAGAPVPGSITRGGRSQPLPLRWERSTNRSHGTAVRPRSGRRRRLVPPCDAPGRGHRAPTRSTPPGGMTPLVCVHRTPGSVYAEASTHGALCTLGSPVPARSTAGLTAIMMRASGPKEQTVGLHGRSAVPRARRRRRCRGRAERPCSREPTADRPGGPDPHRCAATQPISDGSGGSTSRRRILPVGPFGKESTIHTSRGYL